MSADPVTSVRAQIAADPAMRGVVTTILDACDRHGVLPKQLTLRCKTPEEQEAAVRLLSAAAVRPLSHRDSVRLNLAWADARLHAEGWSGLADVLYAAAGRAPRNRRGELEALSTGAADRSRALAARRSGAAGAFLQAEAERLAGCRGEFFELARATGLNSLEEELDLTARCIEFAERNHRPLRLANYSRKVAGSTKALRAGGRLYSRVADALLAYVPGLAERVAAEAEREPAERRRLAMECLGIFRNETPIDVLCYGHLVLQKQQRRLDAPAVHYALGEPCRLLLLHLREAEVEEMRAERVVSIENETTFNDYIEWLRARGRNEIVLLSEGQANWAVVRLLRMLGAAAPSLPLVHWGDLDRFGVLILRSLRHRTGLPIAPLWMDVPTFERFVDEGLPLPESEGKEITSLLESSPGAVAGDLLAAIRDAGKWVEQETVAGAMLE